MEAIRYSKVLFIFILISTTFAFCEEDTEEQEIIFPYSFSKNIQISESNQAPLFNLEGEPTAFVHNCVNVISGQFCTSQVDLVVHHATNPLTVERSFAGSKVKDAILGAGWHVNHSSYIAFEKSPKKAKDKIAATAVEDHGGYMTFENNNFSKNMSNISIPLNKECLKSAVTNNAQGYLSGQTNLRNQRIDILPNGNCAIKTGSGKYKEYQHLSKVKDNFYWLHSEVHPTGNKFICDYERGNHQNILTSVSLTDANLNLRGKLNFEKLKSGQEKHTYEKTISTSYQRNVKYTFVKRKNGVNALRRVTRTDGPTEEYYYDMIDNPGLYMELVKIKKLPLNRNLKIEYYDPSHNHIRGQDIKLEDPQDPRIYRVKRLLAPAGTTQDLVTLYEFVYDLNIDYSPSNLSSREFKNGTCNVYNALNHRTQYIFDQNHRLEGIDKFDEEGNLYTQERMSWGDNNGTNNTCLLSRTFICKGQEVFSKNYQYDTAGNILKDTLRGNLGCRNSNEYIKTYTHSNDGFNLLLEETDGITTTKYIYYPGTNRLKAKYLGSPNKVMRRWFYSYNDDAALTVEIEDDGKSIDVDDLTGATERLITKNIPSEAYPFGYPIEICQYCLDLSTGNESLIKKVVNTYNSQAKITKQDHYDSEGDYRYSLFWEFDHMGNITRQVDALGRVITKKYDLLGNCIYTQGPRTDCYTEFTYDFMDRLRTTKEIHTDGVILTTEHRYDLMGRKIATIDTNGNETNFYPDAFGRDKAIIFPNVMDENGNAVRPSIHKTYNSLSKPISEMDALGNTTNYAYNIRGQLTRADFPDGTSETNAYNPNGTISYSKAKNGVLTEYTYDALGRPTSVILRDIGILSQTSKKYSGFRLLEETDAMGTSTKYEYYPNGKLRRRQQGRQLSEYFYDSLGRLIKTKEFYGDSPNDVTVMIVDYDLLNRVVKERIEDGSEKIISQVDFSYDISGNIETITKYNQSGTNTTTSIYDSHGVAVQTIDEKGNTTFIKCDYNYRNDLGQNVTQSQVTDPLGNVFITIKDALDRTTSTEKKDSTGKTIQLQFKAYDLNGNLCRITDRVLGPNDDSQDIHSHMIYDMMNRLSSCYEAFGTPEQKQISLTYNHAGQKEKLIKNDKSEILHAYDKLGRLITLQSSDGSVFYKYTYDLNNNPIEVTDCVQNSVTKRDFDENNRLIKETLSNGLTLSYENDRTGRPLKITLCDGTAIGYDYSASTIKRVIRYDSSGKEIYAHIYEDFDLSRKVLKSVLAGKADILTFNYDILGRIQEIRAKHWQELDLNYDAIGNLLEKTITDDIGESAIKYEYDALYQLIKEDGDIVHEYTSDSTYNRRTKDGSEQKINVLNQLLNDGLNTYKYDDNGNVIEKKSNEKIETYTYDALDRLNSVTNGKEKVSYTYDENNRRMMKKKFTSDNNKTWVEGRVERFLYQSQNEIGAVDENNKIYQLRLLGHGLGAEIGASVAMELDEQLYVPIHDHNGNVCCLIDGNSGEIVESYRYSAFGEPLFKGAISPWTYASKRYDMETGFLYFGRRYYEPSNGRWISLDPIGREGGPNLYAYVLNSPLTHFDEYGLFGMHSQCGGISGFLGSLFESAFTLVGNIVKVPGTAINLIGMHLIPIPYVKDAVEFGGFCLKGQNPNDFVPSWNREHSKLMKHEGYGYGDPRVMHVAYCGIMTSPEEFRQQLADLSKAYGGITVWGVYNDTQGFAMDIMECAAQKLGIPVRAQKVAEKATRAVMNQMGDDGTIVGHTHSQGAETVHNLSGDLRKRMSVTSFAPARISQTNHFKNAENYVSRMDFVPWADPIGMVKGILNGNVHYMPSSGCPIKDHYYDSSEFEKVRMRDGNEFKRLYGEVL